MKTKITTKTVTYLNYSLSREEQEILAKSNNILEQIFDAIEECSNVDLEDQDELIRYFNDVFNEEVEAYRFTLCGIIDTIISHSNDSFIAAREDYTDD